MLKAYLVPQWEEVLEAPKDGVIPTKFVCRVPNAQGQAAIEDEGSSMSAGPVGEQVLKRRSGTMHLLALRFGLVGWSNYPGPDGQPAKFLPIGDDGLCPMENIEILSPRHRRELGERILDRMYLTEADLKN